MAVGGERPHAVQLRECERLSVMGRSAFGIEPVGMAFDVAEQAKRMGHEARLVLRRFDRAIAQVFSLIEPAKQQIGATHRAIGPSAMGHNRPLRLFIEEQLGLLDLVQCFGRLIELRQYPSRGSNRPRKKDGNVSSSYYRNPALDP